MPSTWWIILYWGIPETSVIPFNLFPRTSLLSTRHYCKAMRRTLSCQRMLWRAPSSIGRSRYYSACFSVAFLHPLLDCQACNVQKDVLLPACFLCMLSIHSFVGQVSRCSERNTCKRNICNALLDYVLRKFLLLAHQLSYGCYRKGCHIWPHMHSRSSRCTFTDSLLLYTCTIQFLLFGDSHAGC